MKELNNQSLLDILRYPENDYKGDGFEFLVEIILKSHAYDNRLGITEYVPVQNDGSIGLANSHNLKTLSDLKTKL